MTKAGRICQKTQNSKWEITLHDGVTTPSGLLLGRRPEWATTSMPSRGNFTPEFPFVNISFNIKENQKFFEFEQAMKNYTFGLYS
ncbi:Oidioi.mRNA.OKI2018_I69.PAR.g9028.t1.cds [Oikopleura dioica]|uniref:Oidioi.mRNA.OKI2018_I69.PAR.g9028.t1.cds n=1 Tax=Oikopleura dioica TaxID=34765 RepID=A0ABN7RMA8_OIKDI|nr:Oidioi.mRNA.OKI2018_I69.PAR.g9028.t1.cds [Oikopleura dioica]